MSAHARGPSATSGLRVRANAAAHSPDPAFEALERLAAVGIFATGIAHELVSPISSIRMAAVYAKDTNDVGRRRQMLDTIVEASDRCRRIVEGVMRFVRDGVADKWPVDLEGLTRRAAGVVQADIAPQELRVKLDLDASARVVPCNASALEQVFVNLLRNAAQASSGACTVVVRTVKDGARVCITVADDGPGIAPADLERIFEPFYSTRRERGGTGLGLALVRRIVIAHGGTIHAAGRPGGGARFVLSLPLAD